jgi:23S rRNA (uracil1939-C5)-methyltransferase
MTESTHANKWLELGAGIGNFSFGLSEIAEQLTVVENDKLALDAFESTYEKLSWTKTIKVVPLSFHKSSEKLMQLLNSNDGLLVDPPRSGLMDTVKLIREVSMKPQNIIYVSCYPESFAKDVNELLSVGYEIKNLKILDQFPQTQHFKVICLLVKK